MEKENKLSPEEIADIEKARTISDASLLEDSAKWTIDENGEKTNLEITAEQHATINVEKMLDQQKIKMGDRIKIDQSKETNNSEPVAGYKFYKLGYPREHILCVEDESKYPNIINVFIRTVDIKAITKL